MQCAGSGSLLQAARCNSWSPAVARPCWPCRVSSGSSCRRAHRRFRSRALDELNPQNVANPKVVPHKGFTPEQALTAQLEAIKRNDEPWPNHGVQTMYDFAADAGSMERSRYFGFSKDLYHLDHFLHFKTACAALVDCNSYRVLPGPPPGAVEKPAPADAVVFFVSVVDAQGNDGGVFQFTLVQQETGLKAGCWMTKSCIKVL